ncbi:hypothetical protein [Hymenobacter glacialis]|uniref:hypothetical protein n=1 Tax=Hymenobacter glacialis TaxID=1908236 RepID=UPI000F7673F5|nr:hypothetical protein [Hymenobacter glacialis]
MPFTAAFRPKKSRYSIYGAPSVVETKGAQPKSPVPRAEASEALATGCLAGAGTPHDLAPGPSIVLDRETGGQFILGQNYPNPYHGETTVPFTLSNGGDVRLDLLDAANRKVTSILRKGMGAGDHTIHLNLSGLGLQTGNYTYQLQVTNSRGVYRQAKPMTAG